MAASETSADGAGTSRLRGHLRIAVVVVLSLALGFSCQGMLRSAFFAPSLPAGAEEGVGRDDLPEQAVRTVATDLDTPWELAFLPGGDLLVTERPGSLARLTPVNRGYRVEERYRVEGVRESGESGLMGLALHPRFQENWLLYLCYTTDGPGRPTNRVDRFRLGTGGLTDPTPILTGMPGAGFHDGCRIAFGPDGMLWVTMGDAGDRSAAQDLSSLSGKIHRVAGDGSVPADNPFEGPVWSWGHRNPQGLAWDAAGRLWSTEHGPSGMGSGFDEVNLIRRGANYGWPRITGDETSGDMVPPVLHSGDDTWAPSGAAVLDGRLFFGGLRGEALYEAPIRGEELAGLRVHFLEEYGRIRAVRAGPDGMIYFATSNRDGRGRPREGDDRIVRVDPGALR